MADPPSSDCPRTLTLSAGMDAAPGPSYTPPKSTDNRPPHCPEAPMATAAEKRATFRKLHSEGCFVIPNPWDVRAARAAIDAAGGDVVFTARSEGFIRGRPDLDETVRRLKAFAAAGADCLYAPGIKTREQIAAVVKAVAPKPVNFLMASATELTVNDLASLGVRRISLGGTLARVAWTAVIRAARDIATAGKFDSLA